MAGAGTCFRKTPPRYTLYAWTPVPPSVEAFQLSLIWSQATAHALSWLGTEGALVIPHLGSGHLANKNIQPLEVYRRGQADWQTVALPAATLQIADLREFAAVVTGKKRPDFTTEHDLAVQETLLRASGMWAGK